MNSRQTTMTEPSVSAFPQTPGLLLQRACACGQHTVAGGGCSECAKRSVLQRKASSDQGNNEIPPIVHDVMRSPGQPLDARTRAFMEPRFGHDFSRVRVHADAKAAESTKAVNALAYTVGRDVVFDTNEYAPSTMPGKRLLAHELTHVVQQRDTTVDLDRMVRFDDGKEDSFEREADAQADRVINGDRSEVQLQATVGMSRLQRQPAGATPAPSPSGGTASLGSCDTVVKGRSHLTGVNLFFDREISTLSSAQQLEVAHFVKSWRAAGANQEIILEGFASVDGPDDFNLTLSCARANTLKRELMSAPNSVPESRITTEAHGETDQFGSPSQNRRVTIVTLPAVKPPATPPSAPPSPAAPTAFPDKIMFWFHAFIPKTVKGAIPAPGGPFAGRTVFPSPPHPFHRNSCFETDDRGFDSTVTASSRVRVVGILDTVARTLTAASLSDLTFEIDCTSGSLKCKETPSPSVSVSLIPALLTPTGDFAIALAIAANDPCVTPSPDLTTRGLITVDRKARTFSFVGATTLYPAFEMYAAFGAGPITIFKQAPIIDHPFALLPPGANPRSDTVKF